MRFILRVLLLAVSFGIGTWILGWWSVPLFAAVAGVLAREIPRQAIAAGLATPLAPLTWPGLDEYDSHAVIRCVHPHPRRKPATAEEVRHHFR